MKFSALLFFPVTTEAFAFLPQSSLLSRTTTTQTATRLYSSVQTGPTGKAASSFEEDLMLTLQIIMDHEARSTTVSKEQFVQQVVEANQQQKIQVQEPVDVSIPYDAAANLAYETTDKSIPYVDFKVQYETDAVASVIAKKKAQQPSATTTPTAKPADAAAAAVVVVDLSIPYDAAAKLAFGKSDQSMTYENFKVQYEADVVAQVVAKKQAKKQPAAAHVSPTPAATTSAVDDISVPYDAAAKLAFEKSDTSLTYADFKAKYEADAVAHVVSKKLKAE